jgi:HK97 family phage prohead protease
MMMSKKEIRYIEADRFSVEKREDGALEWVGYAARFNSQTTIAGLFDEVIRPGAFTRTLEEGDDVVALHNHDVNQLLGRRSVGSLELEQDDDGLRVRIFPPDTQHARDLGKLIERGDISQMSFSFTVPRGGDRWGHPEESERELREILEARLIDVSSVTFPAYKATSIALRSAEDVLNEHLENREGQQADAVAEPEPAHEGEAKALLVEVESLR